jgi:hypothetical protein
MSKKKPVLHEILAVVGSLKGAKEKIKTETEITFVKKTTHFHGQHRSLRMFDDARQNENTEEHQELTTTVIDKLEYMSEHFIKFWDAKLQKETGNCNAKSDITVDGIVIAENIPVTFLLEMEYELSTLRDVYSKIPTLPPGIKWKEAPDIGKGVSQDDNLVKDQKTEKTHQSKIMVDPTDHHPAQVKEWTENKAIGEYSTQRWCSMISPSQKSAVLARIDKLARAIKKSRQRANGTEVDTRQVGKEIFSYIHGAIKG